ncbi:hypothetical protein [Brasilonema bromeliae]|uniref:hypothetical protein n=1 Tax=Brasilonema bromeliae TaxID=383615 RepID=UPI00145F1490|nr:hypothetical protein [Brasilonema bromeliae]
MTQQESPSGISFGDAESQGDTLRERERQSPAEGKRQVLQRGEPPQRTGSPPAALDSPEPERGKPRCSAGSLITNN